MRARCEHGQILVVTAVSLVALLGIAALSIDAAYMYDQRNKLYAAADAAAKSSAFAYKQNTSSNLFEFARHEVTLMGLTPVVSTNCSTSAGSTGVCVHHPPQPPTPNPLSRHRRPRRQRRAQHLAGVLCRLSPARAGFSDHIFSVQRLDVCPVRDRGTHAPALAPGQDHRRHR